MSKKVIAKLKSQYNGLHKDGNWQEAFSVAEQLIELLFNEKDYIGLIDFAEKKLKKNESELFESSFEVAYSYGSLGKDPLAKVIYENILNDEPDNPAVLNNLAMIYAREKNQTKSYELLERAIKVSPEDETIQRNYAPLKAQADANARQEEVYKNAKTTLVNETKWIFDRLQSFIDKFNKEANGNKQLPISQKKFGWMLGIEVDKADNVRMQWLDKGYIRDTGLRGNYSEKVYELNPYLQKYIQECKPTEIPTNWLEGIDNMNGTELNRIGYKVSLQKLGKVNKKYKEILLRDYHEVVCNYIFRNQKSVIILAGSFLETLFMYHCEKRGITELEYTTNNKKSIVQMKDAGINDFLRYFEENKVFPSVVTAIGEVAKIYRNMIHPGNEMLKSKTSINEKKPEICFNAVCEVINEVL